MKRSARRLLPALALLSVSAGAIGFYLYQQSSPSTSTATVGAGLPLSPTSSSKINVLNTENNQIQDGLGTPVTSSDTPLPSTTSITLPQASQTSLAPAKAAVFDPTAARLGTTLSLLLNAWPNGGPLPRQLATAAAQLATETGQPALASAAKALRSSTPREGPITLQVLLLETSHVVQLAPPDDLPQDDAQAEAAKSWFRLQLEKLITISHTPATQNRWVTAIGTVQQQLVRGAVTDARATLESSPLEADPRLEPLRSLTRDYLAQSGKLTHLITTYTNTYLLQPED